MEPRDFPEIKFRTIAPAPQTRIAIRCRPAKGAFTGTRIAVELVGDLLGRGWTAEQILQEYDHLTAEDIEACLAYASEVLRSERAVTDSRVRMRSLPGAASPPEDE